MPQSLSDVYAGKRVFLTGHTGFKGCWLSLWLHELGAEVTGYALAPDTNPAFFDEARIAEGMTHIVGNVNDPQTLSQALHDAQPDMVIHMAAQALVQPSYKDPRETYMTNVMGTVHLLEAVRTCSSVRACLVVTSDKCYENREWPYGYRETDAMGGYDPYSSSKGCAEIVTQSWLRSYFHPDEFGTSHHVALASARAGNVIGGGDWAEARIVPDIVRAISDEEPVILRNPSAVRPWQHVLEPLSGYLHLTAKLFTDGARHAGGWNFGPNDATMIPVEELVQMVISTWGQGRYEIQSDGHAHEANLLKLDISKSNALLGWGPALSATEAIENTVNWYKTYYGGCTGDDLGDYSLEQIRAYARRMPYAQYA